MLHSGSKSTWKINCDALGEEDLATVAALLVLLVPKFGSVEGVPTGGLRLAEKMSFYITEGKHLIVDDVLTTSISMEDIRRERDALGVVIFARGKCPSWVTPLFQMK